MTPVRFLAIIQRITQTWLSYVYLLCKERICLVKGPVCNISEGLIGMKWSSKYIYVFLVR